MSKTVSIVTPWAGQTAAGADSLLPDYAAAVQGCEVVTVDNATAPETAAAREFIAGLAAGWLIVSVNIISHRSELIVASFPLLLYRPLLAGCFLSKHHFAGVTFPLPEGPRAPPGFAVPRRAGCSGRESRIE